MTVSGSKPRVSIGLPVFNGEKFLPDTLDSILTQTYSDFELIISDNASTDKTGQICQDYAAKDQRISYYRNEENIGAAKNYNRVFELSAAEYFKWSAHDDLCASEFLRRCVETLDADASAVLCHPRTKIIDEHGAAVRDLYTNANLSSPKPHKRFLASVFSPTPVQVLGVMRANILKKTRLIGNFSSSDRILAGELALRGRFCDIPEYLLFYREHAEQSWGTKYPSRHAREAWFDPTRAHKITFPHWRLLLEHLSSIRRVPLNWYEKSLCYVYLGRWAIRTRRDLVKNLILKEHNLPQADPHKPIPKLSL